MGLNKDYSAGPSPAWMLLFVISLVMFVFLYSNDIGGIRSNLEATLCRLGN